MDDKNSLEEYKDYLERTKRTSEKSIKELNQLALSREVAKQYGVTDEELQEIE